MKSKVGGPCLPCQGKRPANDQPYELLSLCSVHLLARVRKVMTAGQGDPAPVGPLPYGVEYHRTKGG